MAASAGSRSAAISVKRHGRGPAEKGRTRAPVSYARLAPLLIVVLGLAAYANTFQAPFLFDDVVWIPENESIHALWPPGRVGLTRPVAAYTFALNWALHGDRVWGYHATNLAIHLTSGLLLFGIARR